MHRPRAERVEAIATREEAAKALRELHSQREAFAILEEQAEEHGLELARREEAVTKQEKAATQREGILRAAEARVRQSYEDMNRHEEQLELWAIMLLSLMHTLK
ncbi:hypothetical protein E2562_031751 [Oryza meyeriana var. granulata]|uniref:Uncharacterized protein n=1 Tax=Oryza meyeriana var. granulata TaxID=110450 RepID=A0A6G1CX21_9ORYZ|nr:hypothetical protein E2562_031751 [Oryza meyeriana var. granulata]